MNYNNAIIPSLLYIHWPFYNQKASSELMRCYSQALFQEIRMYDVCGIDNSNFKALYIGGGALNRMPISLVLDMSDTLRETFKCFTCLQGTIEISHDFIHDRQLGLWKLLGINRVVVKVYHYMLSKIQVKFLKNYFSSIAVDCTFYIAPETFSEWKYYIRLLMADSVDYISFTFAPTIYHALSRDFYHWMTEFLTDHGMKQYDWYSFMFPNHESVYMQEYHNRGLLKGFGCGAESYDGFVRSRNESRLMHYIKKIKNKKSVQVEHDTLHKCDVRMEEIMFGLRTLKGVSLDVVYSQCSEHHKNNIQRLIHKYTQHQLVMVQNNTLHLAPAGLGYEDEILLNLIV